MAIVAAMLLEPHTKAHFTCGFRPHYYAAETSARLCYTIISFGPTGVNGTCVSHMRLVVQIWLLSVRSLQEPWARA